MLDVSVALTNPYTLDTFDVYRRTEVVTQQGRGKAAIQVLKSKRGVVYPEGGNKLDRTPEAQSTSKSITIISIVRLHTAAQGMLPDRVVWKGDWYEAQSDEDYSQYGRGFTKTYCTISTALALPVEGGE
jgi:hypothetical protein